MNPYTIIELKNIVARLEQFKFQSPINWLIRSNEHWAIVGANGSGKSILIDILTGKHALHHDCKIRCRDREGNELRIRDVVKAVAFKDIYSIIDTKESYYQQRWNKGLAENVSKVKDIVANRDQAQLKELVQWFKIEDLMDKEVNLLSSEELRKFLIISSLLENPKILILDNPYIGLDSESRIILNELFDNLINYKDLQIFLIVADPNDIPKFITHIQPIKNKNLEQSLTREEFLSDEKNIVNLFGRPNKFPIMENLNVEKPDNENHQEVITLKNIQIKYDERWILRGLNWEVKKGEKWALLGPNGSGKSTLLSLVNGDNPQAYANDITLFGKKRGTGESIWDIKKRIGYISPEMHLYYLKNVKCIDVVGSGFFDTVGLYQKCNKEQEAIAREWMTLFGIEHLEETSFLNVSTGEQRLILLARVLVKNPDLLILDEPMHGLDIVNKEMVKKVIEDFCDSDKTLIYVTHHQEEIPKIVNKTLRLTKISN